MNSGKNIVKPEKLNETQSQQINNIKKQNLSCSLNHSTPKDISTLNMTSITWGKYKNKFLIDVLRDRKYCIWLSQQDWFQKNYPYLFNRVSTYDPLSFFLKEKEKKEETDIEKGAGEDLDFLKSYKFFNLKKLEDIKLQLNDDEKKCYEFYLEIIEIVKQKIYHRKENQLENIYKIKAPTRWLKKFEEKTELKRSVFKDFLSSYELINIPYIIERVKKEGGIQYKGAQSFIIAKARSLDQEAWWERILKEKYEEIIGTQFQYKNCIFDFINISTNCIFECKLSLNDFNESQHKKYKLTLNNYRIIYLIGKDAIIDMENKQILTLKKSKLKFVNYIQNIDNKSKSTYLDLLIKDFVIISVDNFLKVL